MVLGMNPPPLPPKFGTFEYSAIPIGPASPTTSSPRTASFHSTHIRRRSSIGIDADITIQLGEPDEKRYGKVSEKASAETDPLTLVGGAGDGKGYLAWRDGKVPSRRGGLKRCIALLALFVVCILGWLGGLAISEVSSRQRRGGAQQAFALQTTQISQRCNPYEQYGVLNVNTSKASENYWEPLSASHNCHAVDYMTLLRRATVEGKVSPLIEFMQDRTIVLFGDSVDRDHNDHLCQFLSGWHEMIGSNHAFSPPYPQGQEPPPEGYGSFINGKREWPDWFQSRPWVCHVPKLNFRIVNVFHYGFQEPEFDNGYITTHPHFYPPGTVEERFDQIVVPLVESLAQKYNVSSVPDIFSISPGFWSQLRQSMADQSAHKKAVEGGMSVEAANQKFDVWRHLDRSERKWYEGRIYEIIRHVAREWKEGQDGKGRIRPNLLWRALHPIKETNTVPFTRTTAVDQIGRSVVVNLVEESRAATAGASTWKAWSKKLGAQALGWTRESKSEALNEDLGRRLRTDEWGSLMQGQSRHFRDEVHPLPLPGSWLYGNMLLHQLRVAVDEQERA